MIPKAGWISALLEKREEFNKGWGKRRLEMPENYATARRASPET
jgi:hypothetical protein